MHEGMFLIIGGHIPQAMSINALGYAGMFLARSDIELDAVKDEGMIKILSEVGISKCDPADSE
jgi:ATP adenylyltransferase